MARGKGYRMIEGRQYLLDGSVTGWDEKDLKEKMRLEKHRRMANGINVRFIKTTSLVRSVYVAPVD